MPSAAFSSKTALWPGRVFCTWAWADWAGIASIQGDVLYSDDFCFTTLCAPVEKEKGYTVANARIGYGAADGRWEVAEALGGAAADGLGNVGIADLFEQLGGLGEQVDPVADRARHRMEVGVVVVQGEGPVWEHPGKMLPTKGVALRVAEDGQ